MIASREHLYRRAFLVLFSVPAVIAVMVYAFLVDLIGGARLRVLHARIEFASFRQMWREW
jgi:hypothetical protein